MSNTEERLENVVRRIEEMTERNIDLEYVDSDEYIASATEDKKVRISKGVIKNTKNDDELAFVISHEISHNENDDYQKLIDYINEGIEATWELAEKVKGGSISKTIKKTLIITSGTAAVIVALKGKSKEFESRADSDAIDIMEEAGYNSEAAENYLARNGHEYRGFLKELLSSHPIGSERVSDIKKRR